MRLIPRFVLVGTHARQLTAWTIFAAAYALVAAAVAFAFGTRRERRPGSCWPGWTRRPLGSDRR